MAIIENEILKCLKGNARMSITNIALQLDISRATVKAKIDELVNNKTIQKFTIITKDEQLNYLGEEQVFLMIKFSKNGDISHLQKLTSVQSRICGMWGVSGSWDCVILVATPSFHAIAQLRKAIQEASDIERIETSAVLDRY